PAPLFRSPDPDRRGHRCGHHRRVRGRGMRRVRGRLGRLRCSGPRRDDRDPALRGARRAGVTVPHVPEVPGVPGGPGADGDGRRRRERDALAAAITVSASALGVCTPNPPVGAVVLDESGEVVGTGATEAPGGRHAEVVALDAAGDRARGGTIVVTLEPCDHHGRTGPCTGRIREAGLARVVYAVSDPNPVASGGAGTLRREGVEVARADDDEVGAARSGPLRAWLHRQDHGRPLVTWKYAASLDGRVAAADGSSKWITGPVSRRHAHARRQEIDALV